jgi:hypothetical protein
MSLPARMEAPAAGEPCATLLAACIAPLEPPVPCLLLDSEPCRLEAALIALVAALVPCTAALVPPLATAPAACATAPPA